MKTGSVKESFEHLLGVVAGRDGYRKCEGPWNPNDLGTGTTYTQFPSVGM